MFTCKICGKSFDTKQKYGGHMSSHYRTGKKKQVAIPLCIVCGNPVNHYRSRYCSRDCQHSHDQRKWEELWLSGQISGFSETDHWGGVPNRIRNYLFRKHNSKCAICGWGEVNPYTKRIPLEVEHIDGNYKNNRPENLTLLCPNCHSLTPTYRGANRGKGRPKKWTPGLIEDK